MATSMLEKLQISVQETELQGERFLDVRAEMVQTDRSRQETREALTALKKVPGGQLVTLMRPGGVMIQVPVPTATSMLQEDQALHEATLERLRAEEKRLMGLLAEKGAGPQRTGPGMLQAMLHLKG